jgi:hypothetical protein
VRTREEASWMLDVTAGLQQVVNRLNTVVVGHAESAATAEQSPLFIIGNFPKCVVPSWIHNEQKPVEVSEANVVGIQGWCIEA